jgi:hypothetical protein
MAVTAVEILRDHCDYVAQAVTQLMEARFKVRPVYELVTQLANDKSFQNFLV